MTDIKHTTAPRLEDLPPPPAGRTGWPWTEACEPLASRAPSGGPWPRISVITTSYNYEQYIEETLRSVLLQGYPELDYVVIDDGSTDGSVEVIKKYEPWLAYWEQQPNGEQPNAINKGLSKATGDVMCFLNSDDLLEPGALAIVGKAFDRGARWVSGAVRYFGPSTRAQVKPPRPERRPDDWLGKNLVPQQGSFWSAELYREIGGFREDFRYAFDIDYWLRLRFVAGVRPARVGETLAAMRFHGVSKSVSQGDRFLPELRHLRRQYRRHLTPLQALRSWFTEQRLTAGHYLNQAVELAAEGRKGAAMRSFARGLARWPLHAVSRRGNGALRRMYLSRATKTEVSREKTTP